MTRLIYQPAMLKENETNMNLEKAVRHEKAQKAQRIEIEGLALAMTLTVWVTPVSTPSFSFCAFCAFLRPFPAGFRMNTKIGFLDAGIPLAALVNVGSGGPRTIIASHLADSNQQSKQKL